MYTPRAAPLASMRSVESNVSLAEMCDLAKQRDRMTSFSCECGHTYLDDEPVLIE